MPNQCVSTHGNIVIDAEIHDAGSIVQRNADICSAALGLHQRCIRLGFVLALDAVIILQHTGSNGGVLHSTAVENIAHPKIVGELVFQSLFRSRRRNLVAVRLSCYGDIIKHKIASAVCGDGQPEFTAVSGARYEAESSVHLPALVCFAVSSVSVSCAVSRSAQERDR